MIEKLWQTGSTRDREGLTDHRPTLETKRIAVHPCWTIDPKKEQPSETALVFEGGNARSLGKGRAWE